MANFPMGRVKITWRDPDCDDWIDYTILGWNVELRLLHLKGEDDGRGGTFDGPDFWAHLHDTKFIEEVKK